MQCSFEEKTVFPDGSFTHRTCVNKAEVFALGEHLCYKCAYEKLRKENETTDKIILEEKCQT